MANFSGARIKGGLLRHGKNRRRTAKARSPSRADRCWTSAGHARSRGPCDQRLGVKAGVLTECYFPHHIIAPAMTCAGKLVSLALPGVSANRAVRMQLGVSRDIRWEARLLPGAIHIIYGPASCAREGPLTGAKAGIPMARAG
eukprot:gene24959-biopygen4453